MKVRVLAAILIAVHWLAGVANAAPVTRSVAEDGTVDVRMVMAVPLVRVQAFLTRSVDTMTLGKDILSVSSTPKGACEEMTVQARGVLKPMNYTVQRCPVEHGWRATLVQSEDFKRHDTEWLALEVEGGTEVRIRVRVEPKILVPMFLIRKAVGSALAQTLETLRVRLETEEPSR